MKFWKRWIADIRAKTVGCSLAELGAYDRLLDEYYMHENPLPPDHDSLYRICSAMTSAERKAVDKVAAAFFFEQDGRLHNKRGDEYLEQELGVRKEQSEKGREGARRRWQKPPAKARANGARAKAAPPVLLPVWLDSGKFEAWFRIRPARARSDDAKRAAIEELENFRAAGHDANAIVAKALSSGWQGLFAPNGKGQGNGSTGAAPWWQSNEGIKAKGAELGMAAQGNESWRDFQARINAEIEKRGRT